MLTPGYTGHQDRAEDECHCFRGRFHLVMVAQVRSCQAMPMPPPCSTARATHHPNRPLRARRGPELGEADTSSVRTGRPGTGTRRALGRVIAGEPIAPRSTRSVPEPRTV